MENYDYIVGNVFGVLNSNAEYFDAFCITTNGFVKVSGTGVMGRGIAQQIKLKVPGLEHALGRHIKQNGNCVGVIGKYKVPLIAFPVKPECRIVRTREALQKCVVSHMQHSVRHSSKSANIFIPGWACKADLRIIVRSMKQLHVLIKKNNWKRVILPLPGCGAGELNWKNNVLPRLKKENLLSDKIIFISLNHEDFE